MVESCPQSTLSKGMVVVQVQEGLESDIIEGKGEREFKRKPERGNLFVFTVRIHKPSLVYTA